MIELMIVLVVITIVATVTFAGVQKDQFQGAFRRFTDDLHGSVVRARNLAIDEQTQVTLTLSSDGVLVAWTDPTTLVQGDLWQNSRTTVQGEILSVDDRACVYGVYAGVLMFEGQVDGSVSSAPTSCMADQETLRFFPDGHLEWDGQLLNGAGITIVVADQRTGAVRASHIQVFPGGLVRRIDNVVTEAE